MLDTTVLPLLVERTGGVKITRVHTLRTCAVGESNIDQAIGDLMTSSNPTVGLAAHAGQTDVRITAKADTEEEADGLIGEMVETLRDRLGVAIYGTGHETVADVVGRLLRARELRLSIADTATEGMIDKELEDAGYGDTLHVSEKPLTGEEMLSILLKTNGGREPRILAEEAARTASSDGDIGLSVVGPLEGGITAIAVHGPDGTCASLAGRRYQDTEHARRWLVIQGLDWVRRVLLGQMESPVDWKE